MGRAISFVVVKITIGEKETTVRGELKMKKLKGINFEDNLAQPFLLCQGLYVTATGFLLFTSNPFTSTSDIYLLLSGMMPLEAWAIICIISGALLVVASFLQGKIKSVSMFVGGALGGLLLLLYGIASFDAGSNLAVGARYITVGAFCLIIAALGGKDLWITRIKKK